jgi:hypothetical protein
VYPGFKSAVGQTVDYTAGSERTVLSFWITPPKIDIKKFTQTIIGGVEYGILKNDRTKVILRILKQDLTMLYYCPIEPNSDT